MAIPRRSDMRYKCTNAVVILIVILIFILIHNRSAAASVEAQTLMKGQAATLNVEYDIGDVAVADPGVCDYLVGQDRRSLYVNGKGAGETTVTLWDSGGEKRDEFTVRVVTTTLKEALERVRDSVGDLKGVRVELRDGHVEVAGEVAEPDDFRQIEQLSRSDPRVRSRVRISRDVVGQVADAVAQAVDVPGVKARAVRDRVVLEGVAHSAADAKRAVEVAKLYAPDVLDLIEVKESGRSVGQGRLIELEFHLMEVKKEALRELGLNWAPGSFPKDAGGTASAGGGAGLISAVGDVGRSLLGFVFNLIPRLRFIRERGDGRVLENPSIVVKSGEEAKIFSGSEVPFLKGEQVQFKKVGVDISAQPIEVPGGVDLKISATLSAPSADIRGAIDTHTISTTAVCPVGQSVVLGNIIRNGDVKMRNRAPRDLDGSSALFTLFLSKDFQSNRSEFVIFVTPRYVEQPSPAEAQLRAFLSTEETMIRDRSKKEFAEYAEKRGGVADEGAAASKPRRGHGRKWR